MKEVHHPLAKAVGALQCPLWIPALSLCQPRAGLYCKQHRVMNLCLGSQRSPRSKENAHTYVAGPLIHLPDLIQLALHALELEEVPENQLVGVHGVVGDHYIHGPAHLSSHCQFGFPGSFSIWQSVAGTKSLTAVSCSRNATLKPSMKTSLPS